ncbi:uncharacterized protein [Nicotiana tomentosiformis]|uniref:uncharacterized protein n=1 Tax=Nicotiana tomentosiformis TaxID=4098 RepID=UPI00388CADDE
MPEISYRPPAIQGSSSGYSGHQGQTSSQKPIALSCCGDSSHMWRFCPTLRGRPVQQGQQPMITAQVAPPVVRPPRGRGQVGRGCPRGGGQLVGPPARFYAFPARPYVEASDAVIRGIISVCGKYTSVLFDPGSTYSYVSSLFAYFLGVSRESFSTSIFVSTSVGDSVIVNQISQSCVVTLCGYETRADILLLDMTDFEIILGMDWLSPYHAILNCHAKTVTLEILEFPRLE